MNAGERLKQFRQKLGLTQKELAEKLGFKWYKIKDMESNKQKITYEIAKELEKLFSINPDWLLTGEGEMYKNNKVQIFDNENGIEVNYYPDVYASAGYGAVNTIIEPQKVTLSKFIIDSFKIINPKRVDLIHIYGDSMEPIFQNGDIAVVERIDDISEVRNGDTIIANIDGDLFIKKIEKIPFQNAIILKSTNSLYKDIIVEDFNKFKVVAIVRGKFRII